MSPTLLRRYRAERLLRRDFEGLRERVLASVRANLGARGIELDRLDLEACYSQAWHGLYTALTEGQEIENPSGWLMKVCCRRAIDEYRQRRSEQRRLEGITVEMQARADPDMERALDDRAKLRQTFEALRQRLSAREAQAASLCYLQGLSRAQAAARMGIGEARMRKLMEGHGPDRPGVAAKVDTLLKIVQGGEWCEQQASLMRGLAYGVHDPDGERYKLAQLHRRECPACRAYVISLRGLAAVLPPLALPWIPGMAGLGGALGGGAGASAGAGSGAGAAGGGALGGWLPLGGSLGAKLATGCLLLAGVGGGCLALISAPQRSPHRATHVRHDLAHGSGGGSSGGSQPGASASLGGSPSRAGASERSAPASTRSPRTLTTIGSAQRELGFERGGSAHAAQSAAYHARQPQVRPRRTPSSSQAGEATHTATAPPRGAGSEFAPG